MVVQADRDDGVRQDGVTTVEKEEFIRHIRSPPCAEPSSSSTIFSTCLPPVRHALPALPADGTGLALKMVNSSSVERRSNGQLLGASHTTPALARLPHHLARLVYVAGQAGRMCVRPDHYLSNASRKIAGLSVLRGDHR